MIKGTQNPIVGTEEFYRFTDGLDIFNSLNAKFAWSIWKKQKSGSWLNITQNPQKIGQEVPFKFGEKVIGEEFKLQVNKSTPKLFSDELDTKLVGEIIVVPTSSKVPKIDKVILFNGGAKDPNKASYKDTLVARAYCIAMFNREVEFQLWEDDAPGPGHNANVNKNNQLPQTFKGRVNEKGIAEVKISLLSNASILKAIANKYMMSGDKDEGDNHEYYVTASYAGKLQKASQINVDVVNPAHQPKPKDDSPKFPPTNDSKTKPQPDPKGNIKDAYFVNDKNQKLSSVQVNTHVKVQILSSNLIGKYIQYVVWEKDFGVHDEIFRSGKIKIPGDICNTGGFKITESHFQKGIDLPAGDPDSDKQNYFLEIIVLDSTAESKKFGLDDKAPQQMEVVSSAAKVDQTKAPPIANCGEKYCIKKGDDNGLIREINIRLAGFGGNVPTSLFTDRTEKMVKQFQRDYMKIPETGKVCGNTLKAIDEFGSKFIVNINEARCPCKECTGFGNGLNVNERANSKILEMYRKYEYPGIHRTLIWVEKAIKFYLANHEKSKNLRVGLIFSGYRCVANNRQHGRKSTNHMGKALDLHIYGLSNSSNTETTANTVRDLLVKYTKAEYRWGGNNVIALEPSTRNRIGKEFIATTWVHYDVRTFDLEYLKDKYFVKDDSSANGESLFQLALKLGFLQTCSCMGGGKSATNKDTLTENKEGRVDPKTLKTSDKGVKFIKEWESFEPMPYDDSEGYCTIGYGHLIKKERCKNIVIPEEFKKGITKEDATKLFQKRLVEFEIAVQRDIHVKLYQYEFDALVSLVFNTGSNFLNTGGAKGGETKIKKKINAEEYPEGADEMSDVTNGGTSGLVKRRKAEINMFKNNVYDSSH